jgi:Mrp family chromosome partitioning ATPase
MPSGPLPPNPPALLGTPSLAEFERFAGTLFDLVVFDTPPLLAGVDAALISAASEGVVLVLDVAKTKRRTASHAVDQLRRAQANVLGVVLNRVPVEHAPYYYSDKAQARLGASVDGSVEASGQPRRATSR